jgi:hypothetical protein
MKQTELFEVAILVGFFFLFFFCIINFIITIFLSLFLPSSPSPFSCATIYCSPSQLLFLPLLIYSFPYLSLPLLSFPNLSPHNPSLLHTHYSQTSLLYQM